jgi:dTDP-4-dehydrorhamnose 3,5-epimerase
MTITPLPLAGAFEITLAPRGDERGYFMRAYCEQTFREHGLVTHWVQDNQSLSTQVGIVRGLHFQRGTHAETKFVRCLAGRILDVIVDVRAGSPTFGQHHASELSAANQKALYVPRGFAHGFCVLEAPAIVHYKVDNFYAGHAEGGLRWNDPALGVEWPIVDASLITAKDAAWPLLADLEPVTL